MKCTKTQIKLYWYLFCDFKSFLCKIIIVKLRDRIMALEEELFCLFPTVNKKFFWSIFYYLFVITILGYLKNSYPISNDHIFFSLKSCKQFIFSFCHNHHTGYSTTNKPVENLHSTINCISDSQYDRSTKFTATIHHWAETDWRAV